MRPVTFLVAVLAVTPLTRVTAQGPPPVKVGDRVRVTAPDMGIRRQAGSLVATSGDRITLVQRRGADTLQIPISSVMELDVSRGRRVSVGRAVGFPLIGLMGGALIGAGVGYGLNAAGSAAPGESFTTASARRCNGGCDALAVAFGAALGGGVGFVTGLIIGIIPRDQWQPVSLDQLRVSFAPQRDGRFGLGLWVRF